MQESYDDMQITIKIFGRQSDDYILITNGSDDKHVYFVTEIDQRQIEINIEDFMLALRKMICK